MDKVDLRTTELGRIFTYAELLNYCRAVWGGVAWPGKRPGFAVVVAMDYKSHFDSHDIFLLDELESWDQRKLIRQCGALDLKYGISLHGEYGAGSSGRWVGDFKNDAARMNAESNRKGPKQFSLSPTLMFEMQSLYAYILPQIKELLNPERRMLFLKGSKILNYLSEIEESEIADLERGAYPAIEALAFAVIELLQWEGDVRVQEPQRSPWDNDVLTRGFRSGRARRKADPGRCIF